MNMASVQLTVMSLLTLMALARFLTCTALTRDIGFTCTEGAEEGVDRMESDALSPPGDLHRSRD